MTEGTCVVGIHASLNHGIEKARGRPRFRAFATGCYQAGPWHDSQVWAEVDAERMDGHRCPERAHDTMDRVIPFDRIRTKTTALLSPESALRYMPHRQ